MTDQGDSVPSANPTPVASKRRKKIQTGLLVLGFVAAFILGGRILGGGDKPVSGGRHNHATDSTGEQPEIWTCSMHPQIRSSEPGACPICGMDFIKVEQSSGTADDNPARVSLSENAKIRAKIRTTPVMRMGANFRGLERRLLGRVDYDETKMRTVTSWIGGRIDKLRVRSTGERVKRGQVIATLYSPEVFGVHQDLLVAKQQVLSLSRGSQSARNGAELALDASRTRLRLLGVPASEISAMEKAKAPSEQVRIRSPYAGTVIDKLSTEGSYVSTGVGLFQIADLSTVWVQLDAYESDLSVLHVGQKVALQVEALPGKNFSGRVTFVDPVLNQKTRTTRVRIEVKNPDRELSPGMFAEAVVTGTKGRGEKSNPLVIPDTAPLFTGRRSVVYIELPDTEAPTYEARQVRLGARMGAAYPVIAGLAEGDQVVTHGAFTLDADLQIRGGHSMMMMPDDTSQGPFDKIVEIPAKHKAVLRDVVGSYLAIQEALATDHLAGSIEASSQLEKAADSLKPKGRQQFADAWIPLQRQLVSHSKHLVGTKSLDQARVPFRELSQQIATLLRIFGNATNETLRLAFCPMALEGSGAEWVQRASEIENPYFGASMHTCGEVSESVERGTYLPSSAEEPVPAAPRPVGGHNR